MFDKLLCLRQRYGLFVFDWEKVSYHCWNVMVGNKSKTGMKSNNSSKNIAA